MKKAKLIFTFFGLLIFGFSLLPIVVYSQSLTQSKPKDKVNLLIMNGEYQAATKSLQNMVSEDSTNFTALNKLGFCYQTYFKHDSAVVYLEKASILKPLDKNNLLLLGRSYRFLGFNPGAQQVFEKIIQIDSLNQVAAISLGNIYLEENEVNKADSLYKMLILQDSTNSYFYKQLGYCALKLDCKEKATTYFYKSLELNPGDVQVMLQLSQLYYLNEQLDSAATIVDQGLALFPNNLNLIKRKAEILFKKKIYKDAIVYFEQVIDRENASALTYKKLGMSYFFEGNSTLSVVNLLRSYEKDKTDPSTCFYIGLCYKDLNLYEKAILFLNKSIELAIPDYLADVYTHLASSQEHEKQFIESIQSYRDALEYEPTKKILTFYLASVYDQYYEDREIPLMYYQKFLRENKDADRKLVEYAESRIKVLKQELHFQVGNK